MNVWLCPIKPQSWRKIKARRVFGVSRRDLANLRSLEIGDLLVFHLLRPDKGGVVAICRVISGCFEDNEDIWGRDRYPFRVRIELTPGLVRNTNDPLPLASIFGSGNINNEIEIVPFFKNVSMLKISENQCQILQTLFHRTGQ